MKIITENSKKLEVKIGEKFKLIMYSCPSTGEYFHFSNYDQVEEYLKQIKYKSVYPYPRGHTGGSVTHTYIFKAIKVGYFQFQIKNITRDTPYMNISPGYYDSLILTGPDGKEYEVNQDFKDNLYEEELAKKEEELKKYDKYIDITIVK